MFRLAHDGTVVHPERTTSRKWDDDRRVFSFKRGRRNRDDHALGGFAEYAADRVTHHEPRPTLTDYLLSARFWFESSRTGRVNFWRLPSIGASERAAQRRTNRRMPGCRYRPLDGYTSVVARSVSTTVTPRRQDRGSDQQQQILVDRRHQQIEPFMCTDCGQFQSDAGRGARHY